MGSILQCMTIIAPNINQNSKRWTFFRKLKKLSPACIWTFQGICFVISYMYHIPCVWLLLCVKSFNKCVLLLQWSNLSSFAISLCVCICCIWLTGNIAHVHCVARTMKYWRFTSKVGDFYLEHDKTRTKRRTESTLVGHFLWKQQQDTQTHTITKISLITWIPTKPRVQKITRFMRQIFLTNELICMLDCVEYFFCSIQVANVLN